jgi:hypothetical protein
MQKLLTGLTAVLAAAFLASAAQACDFHKEHVVMSGDEPQQGVAMSTYDGTALPPVVDEAEQKAEAAKAPACADGDEDCEPASE